ncbi:MAG: SDR family oxidoreductase [Deltaproteobacteria bacterium]|nr:SDR family oxidoreductase [Deltaproteobacteria bacterium]
MSVADLAGKTAIVTGATAGIGRATAVALCARGVRVHLACRSEEKTRPALDELRRAHGDGAAAFLPLDLADLASVRTAAQRFLDGGEPLHLLINNAGVAGIRGLTKDGFELTFGTNHLGHFLFTLLLLDRLKASAPGRIVHVSSKSHGLARGIPFHRLRRRTGPLLMFDYGVSKLANNLFSAELARRLQGSGVTSYAVHPGVVMSEIWRPMPSWMRPLWFRLRGMVTNEQGARTSLYCATSPQVEGHSGRYYADEREVTPSRASQDAALARRLWEWSEQACGLPTSAP